MRFFFAANSWRRWVSDVSSSQSRRPTSSGNAGFPYHSQQTHWTQLGWRIHAPPGSLSDCDDASSLFPCHWMCRWGSCFGVSRHMGWVPSGQRMLFHISARKLARRYQHERHEQCWHWEAEFRRTLESRFNEYIMSNLVNDSCQKITYFIMTTMDESTFQAWQRVAHSEYLSAGAVWWHTLPSVTYPSSFNGRIVNQIDEPFICAMSFARISSSVTLHRRSSSWVWYPATRCPDIRCRASWTGSSTVSIASSLWQIIFVVRFWHTKDWYSKTSQTRGQCQKFPIITG